MPRRLFEFKCKNSHITESFVEVDTKEVQCGGCCEKATRIVSSPRISLDGTDPVYVSAYDRWARVREEKARIERKQNAD